MIPVEMEVTEAPPAMMEVDSTILERVEKVRSGFSSGLFNSGFSGGEGGVQRRGAVSAAVRD